MKAPKQMTLCFIFRQGKVLLGQKKRGFGVGKWNGYGGKPENNETIEETNDREVFEESRIKVLNCKKVGIVWETQPSWPQTLEVYVFFTEEFEGEAVETEEMKPQWFDFKDIPYDSMWEGDKLWIPKVLNRELFTMLIDLDSNNNVLKSRSV